MTENPYLSFYDTVGRIRGDIPAMKLFIHAYQEIPCLMDAVSEETYYYHYETVMDILLSDYGHLADQDIKTKYLDVEKNIFFTTEQYSDIKNGIAVYFQRGEYRAELDSKHNLTANNEKGYYNAFYNVNIFYLKGKLALAEEMMQKFQKAMLTVRTASTLNMVCKDSDYYLYPFEIKKPNINIELNYGEEFAPIHEKIFGTLSTKDKQGVVLLHGLPGTGKTHYIRYLINSLKDKELIYVPPDMAYALSAPDFLPFLMKHTNAVLIIEDAENIIKDRQFQDNQAVANLLNLSDGLLGDCLNLQIIATFNSDITRIDSALLRKGRLIAQWKFDKLSLENAQRLSQSLGYDNILTEPMTLADIYGQQEVLPKQHEVVKKIGF
ncbi:MAG: AAA family ATPase [Bacteroidia bacterium]